MQRVISVALAFSLFAARVPLRAQNPTAQLSGSVHDPSGAAVPGAAVHARNIATQVDSQTETNGDGIYVFPVLQPGDYRITVLKEGFQQVSLASATLQVGQSAALDFTLTVGATSQSIEVSGQAALLETATASNGQVIETKSIKELPLNGRNYLQLAKLSAGVFEPKRGDRETAGGSFIANGVRAQLNNFLLDGVDNNAKIVDQQNSSPVVIQPSVDALQEFKVETNNYSAEYGYSAGAVINATIKSGTNRYHGDAFEFIRNDALDARNYFSLPTARKPVLQQDQFGGTAGGPVIKSRAFFFASFERTRINKGLNYVATVPTAAAKTGNLAGYPVVYDTNTTTMAGVGVYSRQPFPANVIPANRLNPAALALLAIEPLPTSRNLANNFVSNPISTARANRADIRQDTQISRADSLFARYSYFTGNTITPGPFPAPLIGSSQFQTAPKDSAGTGAALGETHIFRPTIVNEFRVGYNRIQDFLQPFVKDNLDQQFGLNGIPVQTGITGLPNISVSGFANLGEASFLPNDKISEVITLEDHLSWNKGKHLIKMGGSYRWVRSWFNISSSARGSYTFNGAFSQNPAKPGGTGSGLADFLLGIPSNGSISNMIAGDLRYQYGGAFIQDDWKLTPKLTLNLGLRYELWTQPIERHNLQANFLTNLAKLVFPNNVIPPGIDPALTAKIPDGLGSRSLLITDKNNLAPRIGIAYQAATNTVIRAGAGLFFADDPAIGASGRLVGNPPFYKNSSFPTDQITPILNLSTGFPANVLGQTVDISSASLSAFAQNFKQAYVYHWSFGVQRQIRSYLIEAGYVGTKGTDLPVGYDLNTPYAGPGSVASRRPFKGLGSIAYQSPMDSSEYHALEARAEHRYSNGLSLLVSYTYSKTIDNGGEQLVGDLSLRDARNVRAERSLSSGDMRDRFVASALYDLPAGKGRRLDIQNKFLDALLGNWQLNGILTDHSGQPFTPTLGTSTANTGAARPDRIADGNLPGDKRTISNWFDKTAFTTPAPYNFGNAGRNVLIGPGTVNLDASLFKSFPVSRLGEGGSIQFRAELFNALNHPQFNNPNARVDLAQGGSISSLSNEMREVQFALKVIF